jgi:L-lactate utilization protein LutB
MDERLRFVYEKAIERAIPAFERNGMKAYKADTKEDAAELVFSLIDKDSSISDGGSMTLIECGIIDRLKREGYNYFTFMAPNLSNEEKEIARHNALNADIYLSSSNALTEDGRLVNIDATGNRVAAITYGPKKVIIVAGCQKLMPTLEEALARVKRIAAPANAKRLKRNTPCTVTGVCSDCKSPDSICSDTVITGHQYNAGRIHVIMVADYLGF